MFVITFVAETGNEERQNKRDIPCMHKISVWQLVYGMVVYNRYKCGSLFCRVTWLLINQKIIYVRFFSYQCPLNVRRHY